MRRRGSRLLLVLPLAAALTATTGRTPVTAASRPPNVVLILSDDQRYDTLNVMPNVQQDLIDHGIKFTNAFVSNSVCCPSRATILTGRYSHGTGVYQNGGPNGGFQAFNDSSTLATWLNPTYDTALIGKYLNEYKAAADAYYIPPGWDTWEAFAEANGQYYNYDELISVEHAPPTIQHFYYGPADYSTSNLMRQAVSFIAQAQRPFFLYFAPYAPHGKAIPWPGDEKTHANDPIFHPPSFNEKDVSDKPSWVQALPKINKKQQAHLDENFRRQLSTLVGVDRAVGHIVNELDAIGQLDNTMIIYMSDNGFLFGEHRWHWKDVPYDEAIRVPFIVRYDPVIQTPSTNADLIVNIDVAPTIAAVAGVPAPKADGSNFVPLLTNPGAPWRDYFLTEHLLLPGKHEVPTECGIRAKHFAYMYYSTGEEELYNLHTDPYELNNVAYDPANASTVALMHQRLHELCNPPPPDPAFTLPP